VTTIDLGEVPNTVKNTAVRYGWKFRTALNLNRPPRKTPGPPAEAPAADAPAQIPETPEPVSAAPETQAGPVCDAPPSGFFKRLLKRTKYTPKH
jgi:hypothetical protein